MVLEQQAVGGFVRELVRALVSISEPVTTTAGQAWIAPEFDKMGLAIDLYYRKWVQAGWLAEETGIEGFHDLLRMFGFRNRDLLVEHHVAEVTPEGWHWTIDAWELDGRGYIIPVLDEGFGVHLPLLAAWEPFNDPEAFAEAFRGAYRNNIWMLGCGRSIRLGERVSQALFVSSLSGGVAANEEYASFISMLFDDETEDPIDAVICRHLAKAFRR